MANINYAIATADSRIGRAIDYVTEYLRLILVRGGIPTEIAKKYSAEYCHGGEWILNDEDGELAREDIHLLNNEYIVSIVRKLESGANSVDNNIL